MAESATNRIKAIGSQLVPLPAIKKVAPDFNSQRLAGKVVIVTGANSAMGIGRASAHQFAQNGAKAVYICDFDGSNLEAHKAEINASWPSVEVHTREMDAADEKAVKEVVDDALSRYGRLDVFFANAGRGGPMASFVDVDVDDFQEVMRVNLIGPFLAAKYAAPAMRKTSAEKPHSSGSIIMTASVAGIRANAGPTPYSASKAAVISMVQTTAFQLAGSNVRVNALLPGLIETGMTSPLFDAARQKGTEGKVGQLNPLKRAGNADEIARVAAFLGSDESSYVNGQAWAVDGGLSAGHPFVRGEFVK
ncbi:hypothetical protein B0T22DRAFT_247281 [Podospora appendiculata]|uniref:Dehydrogenase n=1 Tax=Podospora appendiculata TaxID=314037 RepID=A0AAE1C8W3_9PEZI|nr:hypothetical protein B0T22DRAFT_247281 [Podospora appendiculata]